MIAFAHTVIAGRLGVLPSDLKKQLLGVPGAKPNRLRMLSEKSDTDFSKTVKVMMRWGKVYTNSVWSSPKNKFLLE